MWERKKISEIRKIRKSLREKNWLSSGFELTFQPLKNQVKLLWFIKKKILTANSFLYTNHNSLILKIALKFQLWINLFQCRGCSTVVESMPCNKKIICLNTAWCLVFFFFYFLLLSFTSGVSLIGSLKEMHL